MGDEDESVFVILQEAGQPADVLHIQIVGGLVQQQNIRILQQQLGQQHLVALSTGKVRYIPVQTDISQAQAVGKVFDLAVQGVKTAVFQAALDLAYPGQHFVHGIFIRLCHFVVQLQHFLFGGKIFIESRTEHVPDGLAIFQAAHLIQITYLDLAGPGDLAVVRQQVIGDQIKKSRFAFPVGAHQADVLPFFQLEGNIFQNLPPAEGMAYVTYG